MFTERRSCLRHPVHGPVFASFDGVTGGMILDLSEQGLSMQTIGPLPVDRHLALRLDLHDADLQLETTGYVAWADALGRAGVRFSELPEQARLRLDQWLALNDEAPSRRAPKLTLDRILGPRLPVISGHAQGKARSISLEAEAEAKRSDDHLPVSSTIQYEFHSLGSDLNSGLRLISERARTLLRGTGAAIAVADRGPMICRACVGAGCPPLGTRVDIHSGFSGECITTGRALRCDDTEVDSRVDPEICRRLGIRSIVAAPIRYQREVVGLLEVFSSNSFAFDEGDIAVVERLAQTALLMLNQAQRLTPS